MTSTLETLLKVKENRSEEFAKRFVAEAAKELLDAIIYKAEEKITKELVYVESFKNTQKKVRSLIRTKIMDEGLTYKYEEEEGKTPTITVGLKKLKKEAAEEAAE